MIVDVHTHPPRRRDPVPEEQAEYNAVWRPDRPVKTTTSWSDYLAAQGPAARSITFGIAWRPGDLALPARESAGHDWSDGNINDAVAEFARTHADRVIGFRASSWAPTTRTTTPWGPPR